MTAGDPGPLTWTSPEPGGAAAGSPEARVDLLALKAGALFVCTRPNGDLARGSASGEGLYAEDTRHLSELRLTIGGLPPVLLSATLESGHHAIVNATNQTLRTDAGALVPRETLSVRRTLLIGDRLHYGIRVRSFARERVATSIDLSLAADFADLFTVRGLDERSTGRVLPATREEDGVRFSYRAADGELRETLVELTPAPATLALDEGRALASWDVELAPGAAVSVMIAVEPFHRRRVRRRRTMEEAAEELDRAYRDWAASCARIRTDSDLFDRVIESSVRDLHALMLPLDGNSLPAAGIPWYVAPFGRDAILTACEALVLDPDVARGTLLALAGLQATADDPWRDAEPGKIPHELRTGELARIGRVPHTPYYGTVDATPLFLMLAGDYHRWTRDLETLRTLRPAFDAALRWIDEWGDKDGDGFVEYERRSPAGQQQPGLEGLRRLGATRRRIARRRGRWRSSKSKAMCTRPSCGSPTSTRRWGTPPAPGACAAKPAHCERRSTRAFWNPDEEFFAPRTRRRQAAGQRSVTSNPAHCLYCGIVDERQGGD